MKDTREVWRAWDAHDVNAQEAKVLSACTIKRHVKGAEFKLQVKFGYSSLHYRN